jgi:hypothetical protein
MVCLLPRSEVSFKSKPHSQVSSLAISSGIVAVAFWGSNEILVLLLSELNKAAQSTIQEPSAASAVHFSNFGVWKFYFVDISKLMFPRRNPKCT